MFWPLWAFFIIGVSVCSSTEKGPEKPKGLDENVCSCSNIVTIDPPKDTEKYIAGDEAVRSNIKLLTKTPIQDKRPRLREADGLSLESLHTTNGRVCLFQVIHRPEESGLGYVGCVTVYVYFMFTERENLYTLSQTYKIASNHQHYET